MACLVHGGTLATDGQKSSEVTVQRKPSTPVSAYARLPCELDHCRGFFNGQDSRRFSVSAPAGAAGAVFGSCPA
jgi:hypothetical protein